MIHIAFRKGGQIYSRHFLLRSVSCVIRDSEEIRRGTTYTFDTAYTGTAFTVEWEKVMLQDKPEAGAFTFQVTLHQNGDIVFVYSVIPLVIEEIEDKTHPVKVGLSDAYIMDRTVFCEFAPCSRILSAFNRLHKSCNRAG